jgi:hypothetical protein
MRARDADEFIVPVPQRQKVGTAAENSRERHAIVTNASRVAPVSSGAADNARTVTPRGRRRSSAPAHSRPRPTGPQSSRALLA